MSNHGKQDQGKRGFVRPQQSRPPVKATPADWEQAKAAFEAALQDHNSAHETNAPSALTDQTLAAWRAARDRLMSIPAPNGEALAFKINWAVSYVDRYCTDFAREAASIMREGEPAEKAMLACYLDALALSGVSAPVRPIYVAEADCPAAKIARELEEACAALMAADDRDDVAGREAQSRRVIALEDALSKASAASASGARAQLALARAMTDLARGCAFRADRDAANDAAEALIDSALRLFGGPPATLRAYYLADWDDRAQEEGE